MQPVTVPAPEGYSYAEDLIPRTWVLCPNLGRVFVKSTATRNHLLTEEPLEILCQVEKIGLGQAVSGFPVGSLVKVLDRNDDSDGYAITPVKRVPVRSPGVEWYLPYLVQDPPEGWYLPYLPGEDSHAGTETRLSVLSRFRIRRG